MTSDEVVDIITSEAIRAVGADSARVALVDRTHRLLVPTPGNAGSDLGDPVASLSLDEAGPGQEVASTGEPVWYSTRAEAAVRWPGAPDPSGSFERHGSPMEAAVILPLEDDRPSAILVFGYRGAHTFADDELVFLRTIAEHCGRALRRALLHDAALRALRDVERANERLWRLVSISRALATPIEIEEVATKTVASIRTVPNVNSVVFASLEPGKRRLRILASARDERVPPPGRSVPIRALPEAEEAVRTEAPVWWEDPRSGGDPDVGMLSRVVLPMAGSDGMVGILALTLRPARAMDPGERTLLEEMAARAANAMERARLFHGEREARAAADRARSRIERLQRATAELTKTTEPSDLIRAVLREAVGAVHAHGGELALPTTDGTALEIVGEDGVTRRGPAVPLRLASKAALTEAFRTGGTVIVPSWEEWSRRYPDGAALFDGTARSCFAVPINGDDGPIGSIGLVFEEERTPSDEDLRFVTSLTEQAAVAIGRALLLQRERNSAARIARLQEVTAALGRTLSQADVYDVIVQQASGDLGASAGAIARATDGEGLEVVRSFGYPIEDVPDGMLISFEADLPLAESFRTGELLWVPTASEMRMRYPDPALGRSPGVAFLGVPLLGREGAVGVVGLHFDDQRSFTQEDVGLWIAIGRQCAQALSRAALYEAERRARTRLARLQDVTAALSAATTPEDVANALIDTGLPALDAEGGALAVLTDDGAVLEVLGLHGSPVEMLAPFHRIPIGSRTPVADAVREGVPKFFRSLDDLADPYPELGELRTSPGRADPKGRSWAALPLLLGGRPLGAIEVVFAERRDFDEQERWALKTLAEETTHALERARLYATEHHVAQVLQESLLPQALRSVGPARVAARYLPAAAEAFVGGDWFEIVDLPRQHLGVAVGDIVGKGITAATAMGQIRSAVRALALDGKSPADLLRALDAFAEATDGAMMSTAAVVDLDTASGELRYACAGHLPPIVVGPSGSRYLEAGRRPPLGVRTWSGSETAVDRLQPGETLILYTDGLVERRDEPPDVGLQRLSDLALELSDRGPDTLAERLVTGFLPEGSAEDDAALVCVRFEPTTAFSDRRFVDRFPPVAEELAGLRARMRLWLASIGVGEAETEEIVLAVGEASANAVEHAHSGDSVRVDMWMDDLGVLTARIVDGGRWQSGRPSIERGRGIPLMRALMDEVIVAPSDAGTEVILRRSIGNRSSRPSARAT